jgi:hypothetical protein
MAGTWDLSRLEMVLVSNPSVKQDIKEDLGLTTARITIDASGGAILVTPTDTGFATLSRGDTLVYGSYEAIVTLSGRTMTWRAVENTTWDVTNDGLVDEVFERDVWQRR